MNYRHFSFSKKESKFAELSGDKQRAIETQANILIEARKISHSFKDAMQDDNIQQTMFDIVCDIYANKPEQEIKKYVIFDSKALYYYPLTKDRYAYYEQLAKEKADSIDNKVFLEALKYSKQFSR